MSFQTLISGQTVPYYGVGTPLCAVFYAAIAFVAGYAFFKKFEKQIMETL